MEKSAGLYGGQHRPEPTALERGAGAEDEEAWEAWEEEWDDERTANGWYESAAFGSAVDPAQGSDDVGEKFQVGERKEEKQPGKGPEDLSRKQPGKEFKDPRTLEENSHGRDVSVLEKKSQGKDPRTFGEPTERWRVQKKRKEKKRKKKKKKRRNKCAARIMSLFTARMRGEKKEKDGRKRDRRPGEVWKMALSPLAFGAELVMCQRCSGWAAEKDGDDGKNAAAGSSSEREQMDGGVEAAKRRRQD